MTTALIGFGGANAEVVAAVLVYRFLTLVPTLVLGLVLGATWRRHQPADPLAQLGKVEPLLVEHPAHAGELRRRQEMPPQVGAVPGRRFEAAAPAGEHEEVEVGDRARVADEPRAARQLQVEPVEVLVERLDLARLDPPPRPRGRPCSARDRRSA